MMTMMMTTTMTTMIAHVGVPVAEAKVAGEVESQGRSTKKANRQSVWSSRYSVGSSAGLSCLLPAAGAKMNSIGLIVAESIRQPAARCKRVSH